MPSRSQEVTHVFDGGWATDYGQNADVIIESDGKVRIPFLTKAENVYYELNGAPHKIGGLHKIYPSGTTPMESGATVMGVYDFWRSIAGVYSQARVAHCGTKLINLETGATIASSLTSGAIPHYNTFEQNALQCPISNTFFKGNQCDWPDFTHRIFHYRNFVESFGRRRFQYPHSVL